MTQPILFKTSQGSPVTGDDIRSALDHVQAYGCQVLYMHSGLSFGLPNPEISRSEILSGIYQAVRGLDVPTLCVPTFTFSFCNGEPYDSANSKSRMGMLNEFIRRQPEVIRSVDPLLSVALVGRDRDLAENLGHASIGAESTFDKLSRRSGVKFLFLGVRLGDCFTYMHYLEWAHGVPYRYEREFAGRITHAGRTYEDTYRLFVRYHQVKASAASYTYEQLLIDRGILRMAPLGDGFIGCVDEPAARAVYLDLLRRNPDYFIERPFRPDEADRTFHVRDMVAL